MKIKSYFSDTVETAMSLARQELGADAMLVHSKRAQPESRHLGEYEVVFAVEDGPAAHLSGGANPAGRDPGLDRLADDIASMRKQIERMTTALAVSGQVRGGIAAPETADAFAVLMRIGTDPEIAQELALRAGSSTLENIIREALQTEPWSAGQTAHRIAAFIGPPGAGKTTTLAKVAATYGLARRALTQVDHVRCPEDCSGGPITYSMRHTRRRPGRCGNAGSAGARADAAPQ
jgi:flagellar biosynthesis protein FlhF